MNSVEKTLGKKRETLVSSQMATDGPENSFGLRLLVKADLYEPFPFGREARAHRPAKGGSETISLRSSSVTN